MSATRPTSHPLAAPPRGTWRAAEAQLPTRYGMMRLVGYRDDDGPGEHVALIHGDPASGGAPLVRLHSECMTGDVFGSLRCDCGTQLDLALRAIADSDAGVLVYLRQEGRGIGLINKIRAYALQELGLDTVEANEALGFAPDQREYHAAAAILRDLGVGSVRLLSNNPAKIEALGACGLRVVERVPLLAQPVRDNLEYLETKRLKMGHLYRLSAGGGLAPETADIA